MTMRTEIFKNILKSLVLWFALLVNLMMLTITLW